MGHLFVIGSPLIFIGIQLNSRRVYASGFWIVETFAGCVGAGSKNEDERRDGKGREIVR